MRTPCSLKGTRAASATFVKTRGDRDSPKGRTCTDMLVLRNRRNGLWHGRIDTWKYGSSGQCCRPNLGTDASEDAVLHEHLERRLMKGPVQDAQTKIGRNPPLFLGTMK